MKATLVVEGKEFPIEINDPELQKLIAPPKKTGYERVEENAGMYYQYPDGYISASFDHHNATADKYYDAANYYSDKHVAENNARADRLMRQMRRFAAEHRKRELRWKIRGQNKYQVYYNYSLDQLGIGHDELCKNFGSIYFDTEETANLAIEAFHDDLIWYFTAYKDSL